MKEKDASRPGRKKKNLPLGKAGKRGRLIGEKGHMVVERTLPGR